MRFGDDAFDRDAILLVEHLVRRRCTELIDGDKRGVAAKVVVEAGVRQGWDRWVGNEAAFVTIDRFGASAPYKVLYEKYGITVERVVAEAQRLLS